MPRPFVRPAPAILALSLALGYAGAQAQAQDAEQGQQPVGLRIVPVLDVGFSVVDSSLQTPQGGAYARSGDLVTQLRPGIAINGRLGRTRVELAYALDVRHHTRPYPGFSANDGLQNALNSSLSSELVDRWIYLDASATITQQAINAYGQQSVDGSQYNSNRTETTQLSLRPYARGAFGDVATYRLAVEADTAQYKSALAPDSHSTSASLELASPQRGAVLGWGMSATALRSDFSGGGSTDNKRVSLSLLVRPDPELSGSLRAGKESTSIGNTYNSSYNNWGGELRWTPSPRTSASLGGDQRYFGRAYQASFEHRMPRTSLRYSSSRDATNGGVGQGGVGQARTLYDLVYPLFAGIADPGQRDQAVRNFIAQNNGDPNQLTPTGYATGGTLLLRRDDLSLIYNGLRTTYTVQAYRTQSSRLDLAPDALGAEPIRQYGLTATATYRLTPTATASLSGSRASTLGNSTQAGNRLSTVNLSWSDRLGRLTTVSAYARYSAFDGPINPYHESSLGASLGLRF